jgi:hypothetical protein
MIWLFFWSGDVLESANFDQLLRQLSPPFLRVVRQNRQDFLKINEKFSKSTASVLLCGCFARFTPGEDVCSTTSDIFV